MSQRLMRLGLGKCSAIAGGIVAMTLAAATAHAAPIVNIGINVGGGVSGTQSFGWAQQTNPFIPPDGQWGEADTTDSPFPSGINDSAGEWRVHFWTTQANPDPSSSLSAGLYSTWEVWNTSDTNNIHFSLVMDVDVVNSGALSEWFFSSAINLTPSSPEGASVSTTNFFNPGSDLTTFLFDGAEVFSFFQNPYTLTGHNPDAEFAGPVLQGVSASNIGIRFDFVLSPGARFQMSAGIDYIPAPAGLAVLAMAGAMGGRRRRRN